MDYTIFHRFIEWQIRNTKHKHKGHVSGDAIHFHLHQFTTDTSTSIELNVFSLIKINIQHAIRERMPRANINLINLWKYFEYFSVFIYIHYYSSQPSSSSMWSSYDLNDLKWLAGRWKTWCWWWWWSRTTFCIECFLLLFRSTKLGYLLDDKIKHKVMEAFCLCDAMRATMDEYGMTYMDGCVCDTTQWNRYLFFVSSFVVLFISSSVWDVRHTMSEWRPCFCVICSGYVLHDVMNTFITMLSLLITLVIYFLLIFDVGKKVVIDWSQVNFCHIPKLIKPNDIVQRSRIDARKSIQYCPQKCVCIIVAHTQHFRFHANAAIVDQHLYVGRLAGNSVLGLLTRTMENIHNRTDVGTGWISCGKRN